MSTPTAELGLLKAVDTDDTADYLVTNLANSLGTVDALFSNSSGHNHGGPHQGGPVTIGAGSIPNGTITSAMIADGAIQTIDIAANAVSQSVSYQSTGAASTTSGTAVAIPFVVTPSMATLSGSLVLVFWTIGLSMNSPGTLGSLYLQIDSGGYLKVGAFHGPANGSIETLSGVYPYTPSPGAHVWNLGWSIGGSVTLLQDASMFTTLTAVEHRR